MDLHLPYGETGLAVTLPDTNVTVITPRHVAGLPDEAAAFRAAVRAPIDSRPLADLVRPRERLALVIPDITRPLPTARLLPWVLEELAHVDARDIVIVNGTGSHRVNTDAELAAMVGESVFARY